MAQLNTAQQSAVDMDAKKILCLAGAGTGKTFCMISRISRLVSEGIDPSTILVLTFTNAAAFEMKERYRRAHQGERIPEFRTFHSFCYHLIVSNKSVRSAVGYDAVPVIADDAARRRIQTSAKMMCNIRLSDKKLSGKVTLNKSEMYEYQLYQKTIKKLMKDENLITFDYLCYNVCELFVKNHSSILEYKKLYKHVFVDEFQDTDPAQYRFIESFVDSNLFVVGDALQAIYAFRGADSSIIKTLADDEDWQTVKLTQNYRSTEHICEYANENSTHANDGYRVAISSNKDGCLVDVSYVDGCNRHTDVISPDMICSLLRYLNEVQGTTAILCRTNNEAGHVMSLLSGNRIEYSSGKKNTDAIHIVKSLTNNDYMVDWLSTYLNAEKYAEYIRAVAIYTDRNPVEMFVDMFSSVRNVNLRLNKVLAIRKVLTGNTPRTEKCQAIFDILEITNKQPITDVNSIAELVERLIELLSESESSDIYVGTIHSSKGLEYDNVFLIGVDDISFRLTSEENLNLFYVGITRAKSFLKVYIADPLHKHRDMNYCDEDNEYEEDEYEQY